MNESFERILFLTSFCCMVCDGDIAIEEVNLLKTFSEREHLFESLDIQDEFNKRFEVLKKIGDDFLTSYLQTIGNFNLADNEKFKVLDVAAKTILADNKIEYSEVKFIKALFESLHIDRKSVLVNVPDIDEYWLEDDVSQNILSYKYLDGIKLASINIPENFSFQ